MTGKGGGEGSGGGGDTECRFSMLSRKRCQKLSSGSEAVGGQSKDQETARRTRFRESPRKWKVQRDQNTEKFEMKDRKRRM